MKMLKLFICGVLGIILTVSCDLNQSSDAIDQDSDNSIIKNLSEEPGNSNHVQNAPGQKYRVIPFEGSFFTAPTSRPLPHERCASPALLQIQEGSGHAKRLGDFSFHSSFCIDLTDILPPPASNQELTEGEALPFYGEVTTFTFANGDELYATGGSAVLPTQNPDYDAEFSNSFAITGGTGRFEGAQGGGTTNSLVTFQTGTDHKFSGMIVLTRHPGNRR